MSLTPAQLSQYQALLAAAQAAPVPHLSFKAGLVELRDGTAQPDKRRGTVRLLSVEQLLHLQWLTRPGEAVEVDLLLLAGSASWVEGGRVQGPAACSLSSTRTAARDSCSGCRSRQQTRTQSSASASTQLISSPPDEQSQLPLGAGAGVSA